LRRIVEGDRHAAAHFSDKHFPSSDKLVWLLSMISTCMVRSEGDIEKDVVDGHEASDPPGGARLRSRERGEPQGAIPDTARHGRKRRRVVRALGASRRPLAVSGEVDAGLSRFHAADLEISSPRPAVLTVLGRQWRRRSK